jgi:hypothetical protein
MSVELTDVKTLRERARKRGQGAVTEGYHADREKILRLLNESLATELVCVLRYKRHYFMASGIKASVAASGIPRARQPGSRARRQAGRAHRATGRRAGLQPGQPEQEFACPVRGGQPEGDGAGRPGGRAHRHRQLPRDHPVHRRQRPDHAAHLRGHPGPGRRARGRYVGSVAGVVDIGQGFKRRGSGLARTCLAFTAAGALPAFICCNSGVHWFGASPLLGAISASSPAAGPTTTPMPPSRATQRQRHRLHTGIRLGERPAHIQRRTQREQPQPLIPG